ncbi:type I toxin-antitoxin system SymE family toxin [Erwinia sp. S43]|uniref:SymE family type I addiction module toxin n=1 Tax=Erwinia sp. INIA01 TaxID=2991500 RepID=UPI00190AAB70|nr:type I toxin-antitoxin system SymE family toxin [Erwinia sp. S43]
MKKSRHGSRDYYEYNFKSACLVSFSAISRTDITATWYSRFPSLHLKGNWLEEAGFTTDTPVTVAVEQCKLVIRHADK